MTSSVTIDSPVGPITVRVDAAGALTSVLFADPDPDRDLEPDRAARDSTPAAERAAEQLRQYFAGQRTDFDLPLAPVGSPFQLRVWTALREIPYGETESYGHLALRIGQPTASRAVGLANGRNPIAIVVPCHRVIGASGTLTGYAGGLERKRWLLDLEGALQPTLH